MTAARLVAVTVTYNGASVWEPFLRCVLAQTHPDFRLVVVDNCSTDGTRDLLAKVDDSRVEVVLSERNTGIAGGNNAGIARARALGAEHVLLVNNDTEFAPTLFADLEASLGRLQADALSPLITFHDAPDRVWYGGGRFRRWPGILNIHDHYRGPVSAFPARPFETAYAPTCCLLIRAAVFDRIGTMDERYFVYWDDTDFVWRMRAAGLRLMLDPALRLSHKVSVSTGGELSPFTLRYHHRNQMLFTRKHHGTLWTAWTAFASAGIGAARLAVKGDRLHHFRRRLAGMAEGLRVPLRPTA